MTTAGGATVPECQARGVRLRVSGPGCQALSLALLTTLFSEATQRARAIGLFTTVSAAGGAIGLVAGGLLVEWTSWRWVMFENVPIGVAVWLMGRFVRVETERRHGRFDAAGAVASTAGMSDEEERPELDLRALEEALALDEAW
jgi:MFS family permease